MKNQESSCLRQSVQYREKTFSDCNNFHTSPSLIINITGKRLKISSSGSHSVHYGGQTVSPVLIELES